MDHPSHRPRQDSHSTLRDLPAAAGAWDEVQLSLILPRDQRRRWERGERVSVEDYLTLIPALLRQDEVVLDLIHHEFLLRQKRHEAPRPAEYLQRFPQFRERLEGLLAVEHLLGAEQEGPATPGDDPAACGPDVLPVIERYWIVAPIGSGGFGVVYRAWDERLLRDVAIKVPHAHRISTAAGVAFLAEARVLARLDHPGIVPVYDFGRTEAGLCYLVSRYVPGGSLANRIRSSRPSHSEAAAMLASVAEALHHAHRLGLVHRDVKPANILLEAGSRPVVADFGLALREEEYGLGPVGAGTPGYMSPEQARGEGHLVDGRTDVYSLGVVLYELLTGRRPFQSDDRRELLEMIKKQEPRPPRQRDDSIPRELDRICLRALGKRSSDRHSTAADLADDLRQWLAGQQTDPAPKAPQPVPPSVLRTPSGPPLPSSSPGRVVVPGGLRSFGAEDADFYLELLPGPRGRGGLPESVRFWKTFLEETDADRTSRMGLLYGPGGCGKSSLVKAGLLPRLAGHVAAVLVEAAGGDTEARLLAALRQRWPSLPEVGLADTLARLRRGQGLSPGIKLVIVLDQFERWLHAHADETDAELVRALRHCDGERVQALVLVRDDFWMGITRFMRAVEVPLLEGRNSAAVDLFDPRHARKVLTAFGRACGALPEGGLTAEQERFLDWAVAGLAEDGKVIPVGLVLFVERVKGKPWTPATWKSVARLESRL